jgi:formylmethanofuran dehydrogenase subunit E
MDIELWETCIDFHGHACGGLAIGYRQSLIAMELVGGNVDRDKNEELLCIIENDACGIDAVQIITGCTLGKGNLIYRPTGKMAMALFNRQTEKRVRIVLKPNLFPDMDWEEWQAYILRAPVEEAFWIKEPQYDPPEKAVIFCTEVCEICGEGAPENKIRQQGGKKVCLDCFHDYSRGW